MTTVSQRTLKDLLTLGIAQDATHCDAGTWAILKHQGKVLAVSTGKYGINGAIIQNLSHYYVIIGRTSRLFEIC